MQKALATIVLAGAACLGGCGASPQTDYPNALRGPDGDVILFDDVSAVLTDDELTEDQKRQALRDLGLEDERLIEALIEA